MRAEKSPARMACRDCNSSWVGSIVSLVLFRRASVRERGAEPTSVMKFPLRAGRPRILGIGRASPRNKNAAYNLIKREIGDGLAKYRMEPRVCCKVPQIPELFCHSPLDTKSPAGDADYAPSQRPYWKAPHAPV